MFDDIELSQELQSAILKEFGPLDLLDPEEIDEIKNHIRFTLKMTGADRDTLRQLYEKGPIWDGDLCSKSSRDSLVDYGVVSKIIVKGEGGYQACTYRASDLYKLMNIIYVRGL